MRYPFFQTGDIKAANFHLTEYSQTYSEEGLVQSNSPCQTVGYGLTA